MYNIALIIGGKLSNKFKYISDRVQIYGAPTTAEVRRLAIELEASKKAEAIIAPVLMAVFLKSYINIPVIPVEITYFDLLTTLLYAERKSDIYDAKVAMVVHSDQKIEVDKLQAFINNKLYVFSYSEENDINGIIKNIRDQNFHLVIGGTSTYDLGRMAGMHSFLFRIGRETLFTAFDRACAILDYNRTISAKNQLLRTVLDSITEGVIVTDGNERVVEWNNKALQILSPTHKAANQSLDDEVGTGVLLTERMTAHEWRDNAIIELNQVKVFVGRKPIVSHEVRVGAVTLLQEVNQIEKLEHEYRKSQTSGFVAKYTFNDIVGSSNIIKTVVSQAQAFAPTEATILIGGESGTGKELFAQSIHNHSYRSKGPFVGVNCAALPESLLESELMGYQEGAFTGAKRGGKAGMFELAHNGTIFLDEINHIPLNLQGRILRVLQEKQIVRLGGEKVIPVNIRIIAASNETLEELVRRQRFREDLFYRLNVLKLRLPPLRERKSDIPLLVEHFKRIFEDKYQTAIQLAPESLMMMSEYHWPGNIRELMNIMERYVILKSQLAMQDLECINELFSRPATPPSDLTTIAVKLGPLADMEQQLLQTVLAQTDSNTAAAQFLGVSRTTLWKKLKLIKR